MAKAKKLSPAILILLLSILLFGCSQDASMQLKEPITLSGDTGYYAAMDHDLRKAALENKHIALTGAVSTTGQTTLFIGSEEQDGICFSCTFSENNEIIPSIRVGDTVQLHGVCTAIVGDLIYLDHCQLTQQQTPGENTPTVSPATIPAVPNTPEISTPPTAEPTAQSTIAPTTAPTIPPTTQATVPLTTQPTEDPGPNQPDFVWIPQSGKKYHSNANCSGMKDPTQISKEDAEDRGYTPCKKCYS